MKKWLWGLLSLVILAALGYLLINAVYQDREAATPQLPTAKIIVAGAPELPLNPYSLRAFDQQFLEPIYQSLVRLDEQFIARPGLAFAYGQPTPTSWEFQIRGNVQFHNQEPLTPAVVAQNFQQLQNQPTLLSPSQQQQLANISSVDQTGDKVIFQLTKPDPEFLNFISHIPILPTSLTNTELQNQPTGTGPYILTELTTDQASYQQFPAYWGEEPFSQTLTIKVFADSNTRAEAHTQDDQIVATIPYPINIPNKVSSYTVAEQPDLTTQFFLWYNDGNPTWATASNRILIREVFPYELIKLNTGDKGVPASQFISSGILGFNPEIELPELNMEERQELITESGLEGEALRMAFPESLKQFALDVESKLGETGLQAESYAIAEADLFDPEQLEGIDLVFIGWQNSNGTSTSFLTNFLAADSELNLADYQNPELAGLLSELETLTKESERLAVLQNIMQLITITDPFGVPVFYGQRTYLIRNNLELPIRLDGILLLY